MGSFNNIDIIYKVKLCVYSLNCPFIHKINGFNKHSYIHAIIINSISIYKPQTSIEIKLSADYLFLIPDKF